MKQLPLLRLRPRLAGLLALAATHALAGCSSSSSPVYPPADTGDDTSATDTGATDTAVADSADSTATTDSGAADAADAVDTKDAAGTVHTVQVGQSGFTFTPSTLTIAAGDTVTWVFDSLGHTVTSGTGGVADGKFCSPSDTNCAGGVTSASGTTYSHVFGVAGSYPYFCAVHFASGMTGTITVTP